MLPIFRNSVSKQIWKQFQNHRFFLVRNSPNVYVSLLMNCKTRKVRSETAKSFCMNLGFCLHVLFTFIKIPKKVACHGAIALLFRFINMH